MSAAAPLARDRPESASIARAARDLNAAELASFVAELAGRRTAWIDLVRHEPTRRLCSQLFSDEHLDAWLICWMRDHDTGFHDHDRSAGAVAVVRGAVLEERLTVNGPPRARTFSTGAVFDFPSEAIHRVSHVGAAAAVTLHVYSPPLRRMGAYVVEDDGVLARQPMSATEELRPLQL